MRVLKTLAVIAFVALPALALAEAIPQSVVSEYVNSCVSSCTASGSTNSCSELCDCVGSKMSEQWTMEDYQRYSQAYAADPNDQEVHGRVNGLVQACASAM
jgi:hypothetical protein